MRSKLEMLSLVCQIGDLVWFQVFGRYIFSYSTKWVVEVTEYSLLWIGFLGAAWVLKVEGHVTMDLVLSKFKLKYQALINSITSMVGTAICLIITWYSASVTLDLFQRGVLCPSILEPPKFAVSIIIPIGSFLLSVQFLRRTYKYLVAWRAS